MVFTASVVSTASGPGRRRVPGGYVLAVRLCSFAVEEPDAQGAAEFEGHVSREGEVRTGVVTDDEVIDLTVPGIGLPGDMIELLRGGPAAVERAQGALADATRLPIGAVRLLAPVPRPAKVLGIGMNYADHITEMGREAPEYQYWFNKQRTCVVGPGAPVVVPRVSNMVDYEGELALVIGRRSRYLTVDRALDVVAGYTVMNDVSVRDWQWRSPSFTMGKSFDSHGPMGPWIVTPDELEDPQDLSVRTWVNDEIRQDSSTSQMIFSCAEQIAYLSTGFTLEVGDVVLTGTPAGVGAALDPPRWLVPGDVVRIEIDRIGTLENPVVADIGAV
jgi:2-keto-4-pentenoate hydratase/2-oxohepta-3-ene-1,7-dioic acid hydratase in catechol pathway